MTKMIQLLKDLRQQLQENGLQIAGGLVLMSVLTAALYVALKFAEIVGLK
jgi:hypothetical protein